MSHIWMSHVTHMSESCRTYEWVMSHIWMSHVTHMNESCHTYEWVMSHIYDSFICVTWLIQMCAMTHSYVWHDSFICVTWLIHMCDMTHSYVWHDSFICVTWLAKETYTRDDIRQKRPIILRSLLIVTTPYSRTESDKNHWFWTFSEIFANYMHGAPCGIMVPGAPLPPKKKSRVCVLFHVYTWSVRGCVLSEHSLPHTATLCNTLQRTATHVYTWTENCLFFCIHIQTFIHTRDMYLQTSRHSLILQLVHHIICVTQQFVIYITHSLWHSWLM